MSGQPSPTLTARLRPGESVHVHHVADPASLRFWRMFFPALFGGLLVVTGLVMALVLPDLMARFWWLMALAFLAVEAALWFGLGADAAHKARHEAVVTDARILWAGGRELDLVPGQVARASGNAVRIHAGLRKYRLAYPADSKALADRINAIIAGIGTKT